MTEKLIITLNGNEVNTIDEASGTIMSINWDALLPAISEFVRLRPDEIIDGLVVTDVDIKVKISRKKGRKQK